MKFTDIIIKENTGESKPDIIDVVRIFGTETQSIETITAAKNLHNYDLKLYYDLNLSILKMFCSSHLFGCYCHPELCMPPGLIYNACQLESTGVSMLENVNKLQHF